MRLDEVHTRKMTKQRIGYRTDYSVGVAFRMVWLFVLIVEFYKNEQNVQKMLIIGSEIRNRQTDKQHESNNNDEKKKKQQQK